MLCLTPDFSLGDAPQPIMPNPRLQSGAIIKMLELYKSSSASTVFIAPSAISVRVASSM